MKKIKVTRNYQVTIPSDVRKKLGIEEGDYLEVEVKGEEIVMRRIKVKRKRIRLDQQIDVGLIEKKIEEGLMDAISD
ncbi:MAG: AbrB/MazE/SpoVT family DNA-binding domain-containing protein [Candidatus Njordarchaeia archaeon]